MHDVVEVEIAAPNKVRVIAENKTEHAAETIVDMAVIRRGVEDHFYKVVDAGQYKDGDTLSG